MTPAIPQWGKRIELVPGGQGDVKVGGEIIPNPAKKFRMPSAYAHNFRYLAMRAFLEVNGDTDSMGQSRLQDELEELKQKFPGQEPEEIWKSSIAAVMRGGTTAKDIAEAILNSDTDAQKVVWMGQAAHSNNDKVIEKLASFLIEHWPGAEVGT